MKKLAKYLRLLVASPLLLACNSGDVGTIAYEKHDARSIVEIDTNYGPILIELFNDLTPKTVDNFIQYVEEDFYDDTLIHQVLPGFIVQGGAFDPDFHPKTTHEPIANEATQAPTHTRGTIAMMRSNDPNSATAEFFINLNDNELFDIPNGYAVFGHVIDGFDVLEKISALPTCGRGPFYDDVPCQPVVIEHVVQMS